MNNPVVLIVDDQELNRTLFASMLKEDGYRTRTAASGQAALEAVEAELPDLILLDLGFQGAAVPDHNVVVFLHAQEIADPGPQLGSLHRFGQKILRAGLERLDP